MDMNSIVAFFNSIFGEGLHFKPMEFVNHLQYLFTGMISIFLVMGVIILVTMLMNKLFSGEKKDN